MSPRAFVIASLLLAAAPARADDCDFTDAATGSWSTAIAETLDACLADPACSGPSRTGAGDAPIMGPHVDPSRPPPPRGPHGLFATGDGTLGWVSDGRASTTAGHATTGGEVVARAQAGWHAGVQVCGRTNLVAGVGSHGESHGINAFAIAFPWMFMGVSLGGEQEWQLRPRLDAQRLWLRRAYSAHTIKVGTALALWRRADGSTGAALPLRFDLRTQDQLDTRAVFRTWRFAAYESNGALHHTEVLPVSIEAKYPDGIGTDAAPKSSSSWLARVDVADVSRRYGDVTIDAAAGWLFPSQPLTCRSCSPVAAAVGVSWPAAGATWSLRAERSAHLAMDDRITVEDRLSAGYTLPAAHHTLRLGAFAALTRTTADARHAPELTGGSSLGVDVRLPEQFMLAADLQVARSYYARLDADPSPVPQLAGLGTLKLERHFNVNPPRI